MCLSDCSRNFVKSIRDVCLKQPITSARAGCFEFSDVKSVHIAVTNYGPNRDSIYGWNEWWYTIPRGNGRSLGR